jgi:hypothetical protein
MNDRIERRTFLKGTALWLAAPGLLAGLAGCGPAQELAGNLSAFHRDPSAAREIGRAYLLVAPEEQDRDRLLETLAGEALEEWEELAIRDPAALHRAVRARHHDDFRHGRTVRLNGWILSRTESRLAALVNQGDVPASSTFRRG